MAGGAGGGAGQGRAWCGVIKDSEEWSESQGGGGQIRLVSKDWLGVMGLIALVKTG